MRKQLFIGAAVSAICLYFAFRGLSFREVGAALHQADLRWVALGLTIYGGGFITRAWRWEVLMKSIKPIPASQLLGPLILGFFANNIFPFRMGEVVRAILTGQKFDISRTASLGTIVLERIFDTLSFLGIFLAVALFFPFPGAVKQAAYLMGMGCTLLIVLLFVASKHQARAHALIARMPLRPTWREKVQDILTNFTSGISGMMRGVYVIQAALLSLVVWTIEGTTIYLIARAFPIHMTYPQVYFLLFFLGLSVALPQAPGYVGTMELFGVTALSLLGVPREMGLPVILAIHGCQFCFIAILGGFTLWREGLSIGSLFSKA